MTDQELTSGGKQPARKRWSGKKTVAAIAMAVGVVAASGVAVYAATGPANASTSLPAMSGGGPFGGPGGFMRGGGMAPLHGEFTVSDGNGGYKTAVMQRGEVTAVSSTSVTAKSEDGYTKVYAINSETEFGNQSVSDIQNGDPVVVIATPDGDNATADTVIEPGAYRPWGRRN
jgi:hypothetical protein